MNMSGADVEVPRPVSQYLNQGEHVVHQSRQHLVLVLAALAGIVKLMLVGGILIAIFAPRIFNGRLDRIGEWLQTGAEAVLVFVVIAILWSLLSWYLERLVVTSEKVLYVTGILNRHVDSTPLSKVEEMSVRKPLFGRIFNYGRLEVENAGGTMDPLYGLGYIPHPEEAFRIITEGARRERMREGGARIDDGASSGADS